MRTKLVAVATLSWMAVLFPFFFPFGLIFPTQAWRLRVAMTYAKVWALGFLLFSGIRLRVTGREHMATRPAVFVFNHTNEIDFFANASLAPYFTLVYGKRELARVPFMGWMWLLGGHPMIDRKDRSQWQQVLDKTTRLVATGRYAVMIAPEGTRTRDGKLRQFKKGPFHIAMTAKAPVVPIVLHNAAALLNKTGLHPGELQMTILPPIATTDWTDENLDERIAEVRGLYLEALGQVEPGAPNQLDQPEAPEA